jgi:hypothetical protein
MDGDLCLCCWFLPLLPQGPLLVELEKLGSDGQKMILKKQPYSDTGNRFDRSLDSDDVAWSQTFSCKPLEESFFVNSLVHSYLFVSTSI